MTSHSQSLWRGGDIQLSWVNSCTSGHELAHFDGDGARADASAEQSSVKLHCD